MLLQAPVRVRKALLSVTARPCLFAIRLVQAPENARLGLAMVPEQLWRAPQHG